MARITNTCKICGKHAIETSRKVFFNKTVLIKLKCGHNYTEDLTKKKNWEEIEFFFGDTVKLRPFQGEGYEFARESNFRCLIGDEPGLGKTFQGLTCLKLHPEELTPCLIVVKQALKVQWLRSCLRLLGPEFLPQIIDSTKDTPNEMFSVIITTYDLLSRFGKKAIEAREEAEKTWREKNGKMWWDPIPEDVRETLPDVESPFKKFPFKCVILDECQQIKNPRSARSRQISKLCSDIPHVIALSGTPIENNAVEYYPILNILKPERFYSLQAYLDNDVDTYWNGRAYKFGGLKDVNHFRSKTDDFIIRRTMKEVLPELPDIDRKFVSCGFGSKQLEKAYEELQEEFEDLYYSQVEEQTKWMHILAKMAKLRHAAGVNKVNFTTEWVTNWLLDTTSDRKLPIFAHHQDVRDMLAAKLNYEIKKLNKETEESGGSQMIGEVVRFESDMNSQQRQNAVDEFRADPSKRIMIISLLAGSEGLDGLQYVCQDALVLERHWNPAKEEQAERRIKRFGSSADKKLSAYYILSDGTIDEWITELIEVKRSNVAQTLDGIESQWQEASLAKELASIIAAKGGKKWRLK